METFAAGMDTFDLAMTALLNDLDYSFAYYCDKLRAEHRYDDYDRAQRIATFKVEAALMDCPF